MIHDRPVLRAYPRADRAFQAEVDRLFDEAAREAGHALTPEEFKRVLRPRFGGATVRPQDPLASFGGLEVVWYVSRREPVATPDAQADAAPPPAEGAGAHGEPGVAAPDAIPADAAGVEPSDAAAAAAVAAAAAAAGGEGLPGSAPAYSVARVAEMIGVPISVVVGWDEQDGLVRPSRTASGQALYSRNDVEALLIAKRAFAAGRSIEEARAAIAERDPGRRAAVGAAGRRRLLVLLAERDPYAAEFSEYFLRTEGYEVEVAYSPVEAEERDSALAPDLAVVDLLIGGGAGAELCARLKRRPGAMVLAISSLDAGDVAMRAGADAFLAKPYDALAFVSAVKDLLGESAMLRDAGGQAGANGVGDARRSARAHARTGR